MFNLLNTKLPMGSLSVPLLAYCGLLLQLLYLTFCWYDIIHACDYDFSSLSSGKLVHITNLITYKYINSLTRKAKYRISMKS